MKPMLFSGIMLALASCAQMPADIAAASPQDDFAGLSCSMAKANLRTENDHLAALSAAQTKAANTDRVSVMLVFVPVSALTGSDHSTEIANSKSRIAALESRIAACR